MDELPCGRVFQMFGFDDVADLFLHLCVHKSIPIIIHITAWRDGLDKSINKLFLVSHLWTRLDGPVNVLECQLAIFAVLVLILLDERKDIVDVDFYLLDELHFKD